MVKDKCKVCGKPVNKGVPHCSQECYEITVSKIAEQACGKNPEDVLGENKRSRAPKRSERGSLLCKHAIPMNRFCSQCQAELFTASQMS